MELLVIFVIIFIIYGAGWIWQTVNDILRDANRVQWDSGDSASAQRLQQSTEIGSLLLRSERERDHRCRQSEPDEGP